MALDLLDELGLTDTIQILCDRFADERRNRRVPPLPDQGLNENECRAGGFELDRIVPAGPTISIIEGRPAR